MRPARVRGTDVPTVACAVALAIFCANACAHLTPGEVTAIEAADVAACSALSMIPVAGPFLALACPGEEALVKGALDAAIVAQAVDAGTPVAVAAQPLVAVHRKRHGHKRHVGYIRAHLAPAAQAHLDALPEDGGAP